jgi:hypothetical protein
MIFLRFGNFVTSEISRFQVYNIAGGVKQGVIVWFSAYIEPRLLRGVRELSIRNGLDEKLDFGVCSLRGPTATKDNFYNAVCFVPATPSQLEALVAFQGEAK